MKIHGTALYIFCIVCFTIIAGCRKGERLAENPASDLKAPRSLEDLQSLLDNSRVLNEAPGMGDASSDNYYLTGPSWVTLSAKDQNTYIWARDIFMGAGNIPDWNSPYEQVFYCNVVLNTLNKIKRDVANEIKWNNIKGAALFLRSWAFYNLAQLFTLPYDSLSAATDLGLPLRLSDNIAEKSVRSSVQQTYDQIISDLAEAKGLLPVEVDAAHPNRPNQPAAFALLSKVYLGMQKYDLAGGCADSCLKLYNKLLDYNSVDGQAFFPFTVDNPEIIFYSEVSSNNNLYALVSWGTKIDSALYLSYDSNDLRLTLYYTMSIDSTPIIRSSYTGKIFPFSGLATDEIYLIRAECLARQGRISEAMSDLNALLPTRWKHNTFVPFSASSVNSAIQLILSERRKELPFRNVRWSDLKRLNKEGGNIHLTRIINGNRYELSPNHARYALPIPPDVIALSGIPQNPR